jgi:hypothetical protein
VGAIQRLIGIAEALLETSGLEEILLETNGIVSLETTPYFSWARIKPIVARLKIIQNTA